MRRRRLIAAAAITIASTAGASSASAATIPVACSTPALVSAIQSANGTSEQDTLDLAAGCTYSITTPSFVGNPAGNNVGLPPITQPLIIEGHGATISRPASAVAPFRLMFAIGGFSGLNGSLEIRDLLLFGGRLTANGQNGGGLSSLGVPIVIKRSTFGQNTTSVSPGATPATQGRGGALAVRGGSLTVEDSTFAFNTASAGGALYAAGSGVTIKRTTFQQNGSIVYSGTILQEGGTATYENDTFAYNFTTNPNSATGGLVVSDCPETVCAIAQPGVANVRSSTFADNGVLNDPAPGIALMAVDTTVAVEDTIVADTDSTAGRPGCLEFLGGLIVDAGGNLEWPSASCGFTVADPRLAALADNGGPTRTFRLLPGSPAIDLGGEDCPATDQRGAARPAGAACDSGAYEAAVAAVTPSLPAVVRGSVTWLLRDSQTAGPPTTTFTYGTRPTVPVIGDWDGDGTETPGTFEAGTFKLRNTNSAGAPDVTFAFGDARGFPVAGDWDGDGDDEVAVYRNGLWQVRVSSTDIRTFGFGAGGWPSTVPLAGDWDGDGTDGIGTYTLANGTWTLRETATANAADMTPFVFWQGSGSYPVVGDWNADGSDTAGVKQGTTWSLRNTNSAGAVDVSFDYGEPNDLPLSWRTAPAPTPLNAPASADE